MYFEEFVLFYEKMNQFLMHPFGVFLTLIFLIATLSSGWQTLKFYRNFSKPLKEKLEFLEKVKNKANKATKGTAFYV